MSVGAACCCISTNANMHHEAVRLTAQATQLWKQLWYKALVESKQVGLVLVENRRRDKPTQHIFDCRHNTSSDMIFLGILCTVDWFVVCTTHTCIIYITHKFLQNSIAYQVTVYVHYIFWTQSDQFLLCLHIEITVTLAYTCKNHTSYVHSTYFGIMTSFM